MAAAMRNGNAVQRRIGNIGIRSGAEGWSGNEHGMLNMGETMIGSVRGRPNVIPTDRAAQHLGMCQWVELIGCQTVIIYNRKGAATQHLHL